MVDDCDAEVIDAVDTDFGSESESTIIIRETFDHLGRSFRDECIADPEDELV